MKSNNIPTIFSKAMAVIIEIMISEYEHFDRLRNPEAVSIILERSDAAIFKFLDEIPREEVRLLVASVVEDNVFTSERHLRECVDDISRFTATTVENFLWVELASDEMGKNRLAGISLLIDHKRHLAAILVRKLLQD